jgi:hypothetical protein
MHAMAPDNFAHSLEVAGRAVQVVDLFHGHTGGLVDLSNGVGNGWENDDGMDTAFQECAANGKMLVFAAGPGDGPAIKQEGQAT